MTKSILKRTVAIASAVTLIISCCFATTFAAEGDVAQIGNVGYKTLNEAVKNVKDGETITVLADIDNATGMAVPSGSNFTIDFDGHTYTLIGPGAGSTGTETNGFQLLKDSNITFRDGVIKIAPNANNIKRIIQNYANLTLENMTFYSANQAGGENYALSFNNGDIVFKGNTSVISSSDDIIAFDICKFASYPSAKVTFAEDYSGSVNGKIVYDSPNADTHKLTINGNGTFGTIEATAGSTPNIDISGGTFENINTNVNITAKEVAKVETNGNVSTVVGLSNINNALTNASEGTVATMVKAYEGLELKVPAGIKVSNDSGNNIVVNDAELAQGETVTVTEPTEPTEPVNPDNPQDNPSTDKPATGDQNQTTGDKTDADKVADSDSPKTGDDTMVLGYVIMMLAALGIGGTLVVNRKKN